MGKGTRVATFSVAGAFWLGIRDGRRIEGVNDGGALKR